MFIIVCLGLFFLFHSKSRAFHFTMKTFHKYSESHVLNASNSKVSAWCRSSRSFPECPVGSDISTCTREMDPVAFHTYTEFFTHAHSICHYLQSESWQHRAENTIHRCMKHMETKLPLITYFKCVSVHDVVEVTASLNCYCVWYRLTKGSWRGGGWWSLWKELSK